MIFAVHLVGHIGFNFFALLLLVLYTIWNLIVCSYNPTHRTTLKAFLIFILLSNDYTIKFVR